MKHFGVFWAILATLICTYFSIFTNFLFQISAKKKDVNHIKKPLNAFMLYMKEMRPVVQAECTLKESAAINQILGRRVRNVHFSYILYNLEVANMEF